MTEPEAPTHAADYAKLIATGHDVQKRGALLFLTYAGKLPKFVRLKCVSGKEAKRTQTVIRRDLRENADSDASYNRILDAVLRAIQNAE